jgi:hypothetical protein
VSLLINFLANGQDFRGEQTLKVFFRVLSKFVLNGKETRFLLVMRGFKRKRVLKSLN